MNAWQRDVIEWTKEVHHRVIPDRLITPDDHTIELCRDLIVEEAGETRDALNALMSGSPPEGRPMAEMLDGLVDTIWVCFYAAALFGADLTPIWQEVHRANWNKKDGPIHPISGKMLKPPGWVGPNHEPAIEKQMRGEYPSHVPSSSLKDTRPS
jgi:predicted HAD superfamily Cof-like phosphohydrolase